MSQVQKSSARAPENVAAPEHPSGDFTALLRSRRRAEIESFLVALEQESLQQTAAQDDDAFASILDLAIGDYGVLQKDLADHLSLSASAVGRWRTKENAPRPYARRPVILALAALVRRQLGDEPSTKPIEVERLVSA